MGARALQRLVTWWLSRPSAGRWESSLAHAIVESAEDAIRGTLARGPRSGSHLHTVTLDLWLIRLDGRRAHA